ncbi:hypothetical protein [Acaryochloris sp. CCMEE 5410]|uniref:hypothetical protein n=1 Tax=Acaryochloris sp. CCMEE 5410 TaxID=310037 RepID=UPI0002484BCD|nr:hypothetical protein [Acaryochloris sp. CCMEE 5410]KAI9130332.1 glutaredoxin [Acaryochloris sp. CCMEE 5410]
MSAFNVLVTLYRWTERLDSVEVDIPSRDRPFREDTTSGTILTGLVSVPVESEIREWMTEWWQP